MVWIIPDNGMPMMAWPTISSKTLQNSQDRSNLVPNANDIKFYDTVKKLLIELNSEQNTS